MDTQKYNVIELTDMEIETVNGGGAIGRIIGWILGLPGAYMDHCAKHPDMSETLMNCM